jgi:hypothetical protein
MVGAHAVAGASDPLTLACGSTRTDAFGSGDAVCATRFQRVFPGVKQNIGHVHNQTARALTSLQDLIQLLRSPREAGKDRRHSARLPRTQHRSRRLHGQCGRRRDESEAVGKPGGIGTRLLGATGRHHQFGKRKGFRKHPACCLQRQFNWPAAEPESGARRIGRSHRQASQCDHGKPAVSGKRKAARNREMETALMKINGITSTAIVSLLLGIAIPAYSWQEQQNEKQDHPGQQQSKPEQKTKPEPQHAQEQQQRNQNQQHAEQQQQQNQNKQQP